MEKELYLLVEAALYAGPPKVYRAAARRLIPVLDRLPPRTLARLRRSRDRDLRAAVRAELARRLAAGTLRNPGVLAALLDDPEIGRQAAEALKALLPRRAPAVLAVLQPQSGPKAPAAEEVFQAALDALGPGSLPTLLRLLARAGEPARSRLLARAEALIAEAGDLELLLRLEADPTTPAPLQVGLRRRIMVLASRRLWTAS